MNKKTYLWWVIGAVVVIFIIYFWATSSSQTATAPNSGLSNASGTAAQNSAPLAPANANLAATSTNVAPATPGTQTYTPPQKTPEPITLQFMTTAQKKALNIDPSAKVQILQMLPDGRIGAYKVINKPSDILTSF